jgi:hypothetical protein
MATELSKRIDCHVSICTASGVRFPHSSVAQYRGPELDGRFEGAGELTFPDGVVYKGGFRDGQFHGQGTLHFPDGSKYDAVWENGKELDGTFAFADGLTYDPLEGSSMGAKGEGWSYLTPSDRRFHTERTLGRIKPAGDASLGDGRTAPVPEGSFDIGGGMHYDPIHDQVVETSTSKRLRSPNDQERQWITSRCRQAVSNGVTKSASMGDDMEIPHIGVDGNVAAPGTAKTAPSAGEAAPGADEAAPGADEAAPSADEAAPSADEAAPSADEAAPSADEAAPAADEAAPSADEAAPSAEETN